MEQKKYQITLIAYDVKTSVEVYLSEDSYQLVKMLEQKFADASWNQDMPFMEITQLS